MRLYRLSIDQLDGVGGRITERHKTATEHWIKRTKLGGALQKKGMGAWMDRSQSVRTATALMNRRISPGGGDAQGTLAVPGLPANLGIAERWLDALSRLS